MKTPEQEFLMGGKRVAAAFPEIGTIVKGIVESTKLEQQRDIDTGNPKFYASDNNPMMQLVIALRTDQRDPAIEFDDGIRHVFVKSGSKLRAALAEALRKERADNLQPGDEVAIKYTGDGEPAKRGLNAPKLYKVQIRVGVAPPQPAQEEFLANTALDSGGHDPDEDPF